MPNNNFRTPDGDVENESFITEPWLVENFIGDQLWCWGDGNLAVNDTVTRSTPVTTFSENTQWKSVSISPDLTWGTGGAVKTDGSLWVWGSKSLIGINVSSGGTILTPVTTFAGGNDWKQISCGHSHMGAIKYDGSLWIWGTGGDGELGIGNEPGPAYGANSRYTPVTTFAGGNDWKQISCGYNNTYAIKTDGSLWAWGNNVTGNLGIGTFPDKKDTPVTTFAGGNDWKQISCGHSCVGAIKTDGSLWMWGENNSGSLGVNDNVNRLTPVTTFIGGNDWKQVATSENLVAAVKTDGSLWLWGENNSGSLGVNDNVDRLTPVTTLAGGYNWKQVSCGGSDVNVAAVKTDGSLWLWGFNSFGVLGNNTHPSTKTPVTTYAGGNNWKQVSCGYDVAFAVTSGPDY